MRRWIPLALCLGLCSCKSFSEWVGMLGYTEIRAPSTLYPPGTLVYLESREPFEAEIICDANEVLGEGFVPRESRTVTVGSTKQKSRTIKFNVDAAALAGGNVDIHAIKNIKVQMTNPRIYYITFSDLDRRLPYVQNRCLRQIAQLRRSIKNFDKRLTMVSRVLAADASYTVDWDEGAGLDAYAKIAQLENLAADLQLSATRVGSKTISAAGVYWGIQDLQEMASMLDPVNIPRPARDSRLFTPEDSVEVTNRASQVASARPQGQLPVAPVEVAQQVLKVQQDDDTKTLDPRDPNFASAVIAWLPPPPDAQGSTASDLVDEQSHAAAVQDAQAQGLIVPETSVGGAFGTTRVETERPLPPYSHFDISDPLPNSPNNATSTPTPAASSSKKKGCRVPPNRRSAP